MSFSGTEHYRSMVKRVCDASPVSHSYHHQRDVEELCDHIEDLQKKNEQAWERAALEARRVLKNGSKARKLERQVEEQDKEIERLKKENENCCMVAAEAIGALWRRGVSTRTESSEGKP